MTREDLRVAVKEALNKSNNIAIQAGTGVGKSKLALELLYELGSRQLDTLKVLIVVAERAHINNWNAEMIKWNLSFGNATIICYASLKKYANTKWDAIIFDEAHHLGSDLRLDIFSTLSAKNMIFLSATLKNSLLWELSQYCGHIESVKMGLQEAFDSNILPEPKIKLIPLKLDNKNYTETVVQERGYKSRRRYITCIYPERWKYLRNRREYPNLTLTIVCTQQQKYDFLSEQFEYYKSQYMRTRNEAMKNKWLQYGSKRKMYIGLLKTNHVKQILETVKDKRFICFCTNIEQAETLGGKNAIHSKMKNPLEIVNKFNNKEIDNLFAVGMLKEGMNLNDIQVGIIVQLDGQEISFIQKFGRTLRAESPVQYIIYYRGTRDEEYLKKALENINKDYIEEVHL